MKLSNCIEIISGGTPSTSKNDFWDGDIPWISIKDFNNSFKYIYKTEKSITKQGLEKSSTNMLYKNDIIISARGTVGCLAQIFYPMAFNQSCYGIRTINKDLMQNYLYYWLIANIDKFKKQTHGAVFDTITKNTFNNIEINYPSLVMQQHIVDIIGSIDDKIENNNKIIEKFNKFLKIKTNELLLYKTKKIQLNDIIEECKEKTDIELTPYSVVNTGKVIIQNEQFNKEIAKNIKGKYKKIKKDFFVYNPSRINIGSIGMMEDEIGCVSPIYIVFKCGVEYKIYLQQLLTFEFMIKEINKRCSGSVRQALPFKDLCSIEIYDIERDKLKLYNKYCENIIKTIKKLEEENLKLQQLKNNYLAKFF